MALAHLPLISVRWKLCWELTHIKKKLCESKRNPGPISSLPTACEHVPEAKWGVLKISRQICENPIILSGCFLSGLSLRLTEILEVIRAMSSLTALDSLLAIAE